MSEPQQENVTDADLEQAAADMNEAEGRDTHVSDDDEKLREAGKRALEAEREARKKADKENAELRARIEEFEDSKRTVEEKRERELERLRRSAESEKQRADALERQILVTAIAREAGLPDEMAGRLQGDSAEDLRADAAELKSLIGGRTRGLPRVPEAGAAHEAPVSTSELFASAFSRALDNS